MDESPLGKVYIPRDGVIMSGRIAVRYEKHPWIEQFEVDGIRPAPVRRTGIGTKGVKGFVKSLSTIYSGAYDDYRNFGGDDGLDAHGYFAHAADHFLSIAEEERMSRLQKLFFGYVENMWREGDEEILDIVLRTVIPAIRREPKVWERFKESVTDEFRAVLNSDKALT